MFVPATKRVTATAVLVIMFALTGCVSQNEPASVDATSTPGVDTLSESHTVIVPPSRKVNDSIDDTQSTVKQPLIDDTSVSSEVCKGVSDEILSKFHGVMKCAALQDAVTPLVSAGFKPASVEAYMDSVYFELCMKPVKPRKMVPPIRDADAPPATVVPLPDYSNSSDKGEIEHPVDTFVNVCK